MDRGYGTRLFCAFIILFVFALVLGCATTKNMVQMIMPNKPTLKKQVMVFPFLDFSRLEPTKTEQITSDFIAVLGKSSNHVYQPCPKGVNLPTKTWAPEFMTLAHSQLIKETEDLGMNVIVYGTLNPVEIENKKTGIWPFRKSSKIFKITVLVNVVDAADGCLLLTNLMSENMAFHIDETEKTDEKALVEQTFEKKIPRLLKHQAAVVVEKLDAEPWTGKILDVSADTMKINAGRQIGVSPKQQFAVYEQGESIHCLADKPLDLLGKMAGEIKVTSVMDDYSLAVAVKGGPFSAGQTIRLEN